MSPPQNCLASLNYRLRARRSLCRITRSVIVNSERERESVHPVFQLYGRRAGCTYSRRPCIYTYVYAHVGAKILERNTAGRAAAAGHPGLLASLTNASPGGICQFKRLLLAASLPPLSLLSLLSLSLSLSLSILAGPRQILRRC